LELSNIIIERIDYNIFETKNLEEKDNVTSCVLSSTNYNTKLFIVCRTQFAKKILYNWINRSMESTILIY